MCTRLTIPLLILMLLLLPALPARAAGLREVIKALEAPFQAETPDRQKIRDYTAEFFQESRIASLDRLQRARGEVSVRFDYRPGQRQVPLVMFHWEYREPTTQELVSDGRTLWVYLPENNQVIQSDIEFVSKARENDPMTFLTGLGNLSRDFQIGWAEPNRDSDGNYVLNLRPRRTTSLINRMVIVVDRYAVEGDGAQSAAPAEPAGAVPATRRRDVHRTAPVPGDGEGSRSAAFFEDDFDPRQAMQEAAPAEPRAIGQPPLSETTRRYGDGPVFPILSTTVYDPNGNSTTIEFGDIRVNRGLPAGQFNFTIPPGVEVVRPTGKEMGF